MIAVTFYEIQYFVYSPNPVFVTGQHVMFTTQLLVFGNAMYPSWSKRYELAWESRIPI